MRNTRRISCFLLDPAAFGFEVDDAYLTITALDMPAAAPADVLLPGTRIVVPAQELGRLGRYLVRAELSLGTPASTSAHGLLRSGEMVFKGRP